MARKALLDTYYTFTPSTRTVVIPRAVPRERLVLITNVTTNQVIYNFSDATLKATSYTIGTDSIGNTTTTIVLAYNTAALSATDKLQILVDEYDETFKPSEVYTDPVNKFRVSTPQSMIDTDFEYGTQSTKWESLSLLNNRPFAYYTVTTPLANVTDVQVTNGSRTVTVTLTSGAPAAGTPIYIQDSLWAGGDGLYMIDTSNGTTSFTYTARIQYSYQTGSIFSSLTVLYTGTLFSNAAIGISSIGFSGNVINVVTSVPHGLSLGNEIALTGTNQTNANGSWFVANVANATSFSTFVTSVPGGAITGGSLYVRPQGQYIHRAFDGGVQFTAAAQSANHQLIRQTRRYFRYQSGKGIQMSTGTILKPNINVDYISASSTTITVQTKVAHFISPGINITIAGCNEAGYNGTFTVASVIDPYRFTYVTSSAPTVSPASGQYTLSIANWYGSLCRLGMFDNQNGIFFEFDGQTLYSVKRASTYQLSGLANVAAGGSVVSGATLIGQTTLYSKQLAPNDFIVIKGTSYRVVNINSDTSITISPAYRGLTNANLAIISKTVDTKIPQNLWNIDRCDGSGPSGFNLDLGKMQMFYLDYSWYGAGFIRWGFRGPAGDIIYCNKVINNNVNSEAYMRSGNLPARYETNTFSRTALLASSAATSDTTINISDHSGWPPAGIACIRNTNQVEYVNYSAKSQVANVQMTTTAGSQTMTATSTTGIVAGQYVVGTGIASGTTVQSFVTNTSVTLSQPSTFTGTQFVLFGPTLTISSRGTPTVFQTVAQTANVALVTAGNTVNVTPGMFVVGGGIPPNTFVSNVVASTSILLSQAPTTSTTQALQFSSMGTGAAQTWTYSATAPVAVESHAPNFSPSISHWGSSVIMDGRYDDDKSLVFTQGMITQLSVTSAGGGQAVALQSFRIAPSVSNGIPGVALGNREIVNRMQMVLRQMDVLTNGQFLMTVVLNGTANVASSWTSVGGSSLAQYVNHTGTTVISGGETIFGFYLNTGSGGTSYAATQQDLALVRDLGTSILAGGHANNTVGIYPDGPDIVTVVARNIGTTTANVFARMSWTEAQA
jgi:hypothetical protein